MGEVVPARTSPTQYPPSSPTVHQLWRLALLRVNPYMSTQTREEDLSGHLQSSKRLNADFSCVRMSPLVVCKQKNSVVMHDTECPY